MIPSKDYHQYTNYDLEPGGLKKLDFIVKKIQQSSPNNLKEIKILDVGCGNGNIALPLAYLGHSVVALDVYLPAIEELNKKNQFENLKTVNDSFENYHPPTKFDVVIMSEFLEHTENPKSVLNKAKEILNESGLIILTIPNGLSLEETIRRVSGSTSGLRALKKKVKMKMRDQEVQSSAESTHLHFWSLLEIKSLLRSAGFKILDLKSASFLFKEAYYLIGRFLIKRGSWLFHQIDRIDSNFTKFIPPILASGWIIVTQKNE